MNDLFYFFDINDKGFIETRDLVEQMRYLELKNLESIVKMVDLFVDRYDLDKDGRLMYTDFGTVFLPNEPNYKQVVLDR